MFKNMTVRQICIGAVIAALYVVLTVPLSSVSFGPIQFRPAEALTILPIFFIEAIPGLFVGCLISNFMSPFGPIDIIVGSSLTLVAAILTRLLRKNFVLAGLPPVLLNAVGLPIMWLIMQSDVAYILNFVSIFLTQAIFVYGLGIPLFFSVRKLKPLLYSMQK